MTHWGPFCTSERKLSGYLTTEFKYKPTGDPLIQVSEKQRVGRLLLRHESLHNESFRTSSSFVQGN